MAQEFTREEFHALVWSKPITHLAREFGLSDVALHKICRKHTIPTPPAGWWAKKAAGKPVKIELLPERMGDLTDRITISGRELRNEPDLIAEARENARVALSAVAIAEAAPVHPIVARTIARLRKARPVGNGLVCTQGPNLIRAEVAPASIDRLEISLNRIAAALQASGADIRPGENAARIVIGEETISFSVSEVIRREKHVLTAKEQAKQDAWDRRQERRASNPWGIVKGMAGR